MFQVVCAFKNKRGGGVVYLAGSQGLEKPHCIVQMAGTCLLKDVPFVVFSSTSVTWA